MKWQIFTIILTLAVGLISCDSQKIGHSVSKVEIRQNEYGNQRIYVDGEEFYVKGAGCEGGNVGAIASHGGNSFRTWMDQKNHPSYESVLEEAQKHGLKVLMGLEIGRERHGFNYDDEAWVSQQFDSIEATVLKYKDHPALLAWVIGNEINLGTKNMKVYNAVNDISKMIHTVDPNHLTTTTFAGIGRKEVDYINEHCTDIDFLCIQMYGDIINLESRISEAGYDGPYLVTEWGATGHWEVARTEWDVAIEPTSKEKAHSFIERYQIAIESDSVNCMGSYVFLWGQKQERTPTWYGMFLENGNETETVDAMHNLWNGQWPENRSPSIESFILNGKTAYDNIKLKAGDEIIAEAIVKDFENDSLSYHWELIPESTDLGLGGDYESRPETILSFDAENKAQLNIPLTPGPYRMFVYATDPGKKSATANIPFLVEE